jgi:hypothetical protein
MGLSYGASHRGIRPSRALPSMAALAGGVLARGEQRARPEHHVPDSVEAIAEDGNITLAGTVAYGTERAAAAEAVAGLAGVRNVWNDIMDVRDEIEVTG